MNRDPEEITSAELEDYLAEGWKETEGVWIRAGRLVILRREDEKIPVIVTNAG